MARRSNKSAGQDPKLWLGAAAVFLLGIFVGTALDRPSSAKVAAPIVRPAPSHAAGVTQSRPPLPSTVSFVKGKGKIAIVLDDWGYNLRQLPSLGAIRKPLTIAVLPSLPHSADVAKEAAARGHEVILHMPMQAVDSHAPREEGTLLTQMSRRQVADLLSRSLATVPTAKGISNHQGSLATADQAFMEVLLKEAKNRNLYFLDSFVTQGSVCEEAADRVGVRFARRAIFLDNEQTSAAIERQLRALTLMASQEGHAIGIGHDRPVMLRTLEKALPALEKAGYQLVRVSDLAEEP